MGQRLTGLLTALLTLGAGAVAPSPAGAESSSVLRDLVTVEGGARNQVDSPQFAYLRELDPDLQTLAAGDAFLSGAGLTSLGPAVTLAGTTLVDVYVNGDMGDAVRRLRGLGMQVKAVSDHLPERMVEGYLPLSAATDAAALADTTAVVAVSPGETDTGSVLSEGD